MRAVRIGALILFAGGAALAELPPGTRAPTTQERSLFDQRLARLKTSVSLMPIAVNDAIGTFSQPLTRTIDCPAGKEARRLTIRITTQLVDWDPALAESGSTATYSWNAEDVTLGNERTVTCANWLMIDPDVAAENEAAGVPGQIIGEGLLYHELLHCELLIDAMASDSDWIRKLCDGKFDLSKIDPNHAVIGRAVDAYLKRVRALSPR